VPYGDGRRSQQESGNTGNLGKREGLAVSPEIPQQGTPRKLTARGSSLPICDCANRKTVSGTGPTNLDLLVGPLAMAQYIAQMVIFNN
jgi:hypothetical protein